MLETAASMIALTTSLMVSQKYLATIRIGHSLGGTLAAIFAASSPESIRVLTLLCAPLCLSQGRAASATHWSRLVDATLSMADQHAMEIHARVERWALDEVPLPGKLVHQLIESLYRKNRFCRGALLVRGRNHQSSEHIGADTCGRQYGR
jgi:polyhydroxyalkanoate synthase